MRSISEFDRKLLEGGKHCEARHDGHDANAKGSSNGCANSQTLSCYND